MGLGQNAQQRKIYLNIKDGKIERRESGKIEQYDFIEGDLEKIYTRKRNFNGEEVLYWYLDIIGEEGEIYALGFPYKDGVFKSVILSLASAETIGIEPGIKIHPYKKDGFTRVQVFQGEKKLDWICKELPPVKYVEIAGQKVKDEGERMALISSLVEKISSRLAKQ